MKKKLLASAIITTIAWQGSAMAEMNMEERQAQVEQRLRYMEQRLADQDKQIAKQAEDQSGGWAPGVEIGGVIELEATHVDEEHADEVSDLNLATVEVSIEAQVTDWVSGAFILLAEDINDGGVSVDVDEATITLGNSEVSPFYFTGGRMAMPFGSFETHMVSDPLTLTLGETKNATALAGVESGGFSAALYLFNGATGKADADDTIDNDGIAVGYAWEGDDSSLNVGASYINDISESDGIAGAVTDSEALDGEVAGYALFASYSYGSASLMWST